jgi:hypothetical protein
MRLLELKGADMKSSRIIRAFRRMARGISPKDAFAATVQFYRMKRPS